MRLTPVLKPELVTVVEGASTKDEVLRRLASVAHRAIPQVSEDVLFEELSTRERGLPTSTPEGVAFPHAMLAEEIDTVVVPAIVRPGVAFGFESHPPADLVFAMFGSANRPFSHVSLLARLARIAHGDSALERLRQATTAPELYAKLLDEDRRHGS